MSLDNRLDDVERALSPKELVISWIRETHQWGSLEAYVSWLLDQPEDTLPLVKLSKVLYEGTKQRMKGQPAEELGRVYRARRCDLVFLFNLHADLNQRVALEVRPLSLHALLLREQWHRLQEQQIAEEKLAELRLALGKPRPRKGVPVKTDQRRRRAAGRTEAHGLGRDVRACLDAAALLSRRYFCGEKLLYPDLERSLENLLAVVESLVMLSHPSFRNEAERKRATAVGEATPIDRYSPEGKALAKEMVALARAETHAALGEEDMAVRVAEEWLRSSVA